MACNFRKHVKAHDEDGPWCHGKVFPLQPICHGPETVNQSLAEIRLHSSDPLQTPQR